MIGKQYVVLEEKKAERVRADEAEKAAYVAYAQAKIEFVAGELAARSRSRNLDAQDVAADLASLVDVLTAEMPPGTRILLGEFSR